jgi:hypothetical protein
MPTMARSLLSVKPGETIDLWRYERKAGGIKRHARAAAKNLLIFSTNYDDYR